ncbi:hypothetical protein [Moritella viscosa]|uniref:Probable bacteriophage tail fiber protein n=1 Tax=Moritella viscosa TaxID=80854 RepID=A0ABY1HI00_9GAMM|nr:hypothetical protein [Moritella viscosa]SGY99869.1 Probable bacteriophage tail fiber protein [Moritella viscosa]SHO28020.1 Probable bacteriophage tail fiber protein [Moritella viscosa]
MAIEQDIAELVQASNNLTGVVDGKMKDIDKLVADKKVLIDQYLSNVVSNINGVDVHKQGRIKTYFIQGNLSSGGHTREGGPDDLFPVCAAPKSPTYLNLIEFIASSAGFGGGGDMFRVEFMITHRGMAANTGYTNHLIFTGTSSSDSVAGLLELKKIAKNGELSLFISEPSGDKEVALTRDLEGTALPVSFRSIGQGRDNGIARVTLKVDTRYHCGADRSFGAHIMYTSDKGRPSVARVTQIKPTWEE